MVSRFQVFFKGMFGKTAFAHLPDVPIFAFSPTPSTRPGNGRGSAAAVGELVRLRVFDNLPDVAEPILRDRPLETSTTGPSDFWRT